MKACLLIAHLFFIPFSIAQTPVLDEQLISNSPINTIISDVNGYLWIGTQNGLVRFDGINSKTYRYNTENPSSVLGNIVNGLKMDNNQNLWVVTDLGLSVYNDSIDSFHQIPLKGQDGKSYFTDIYDLIFTPNDQLVILSNENLYVFNSPKDIEQFDFVSYDSNTIHLTGGRSMIKMFNSEIWIATDGNGIQVFNLENGFIDREQTAQLSHLVQSRYLTTIFRDMDQKIWVGSLKEGAYRIDPQTMSVEFFSAQHFGKFTNIGIFSITKSSEDSLIFATSRGIYKYDEGKGFLPVKKKTESLLDTQPSYDIEYRAIYIDSLGITWYGTYNNGLLMSMPDKFNTGFKANTQQKQTTKTKEGYNVLCLSNDAQGRLWMGTDKKGVRIFQKTNDHYSEESQLDFISGTVTALQMSDSLHMWVGTYDEGIISINIKTLKKTELPSGLKELNNRITTSVVNFLIDSSGRLWISTNGNGLFIYDPLSDKTKHFERGRDVDELHLISSNHVLDVMEDKMGYFWIATYYGLNRLDPMLKEFQKFFYTDKKNQSVCHNWIYDVIEDNSGNIWIATANGLNLFDNDSGQFSSFQKDDGLSGNTVYACMEDEIGNIWMSTNKGISRINIKTGIISTYFLADGLHSNLFNRGSKSKGSDGEMLFGGPNGFTSFYPKEADVPIPSPKIRFTNLNFINETKQTPEVISKINSIELSHNQNFFTVGFSILSFVSPEKVRIFYQIKGISDAWIETTETNINFTGLSPGKYKLTIRAGINKYSSEFSQKELSIIIKKPWWNRWYALVAYSILFLLGVLLLKHFTQKLLSQKNQIYLAQIESENQQNIFKARIKFFSNISHELKTPLTLILNAAKHISQTIVNEKRIEIIIRNGYLLLDSINQLMDFHRIEEGVLVKRVENIQIVSLLKSIASPFVVLAKDKNLGFEFENYIGNAIIPVDSDKLEKIVKNLLSNAFKFSLRGKIVLRISIEKKDNTETICKIEVEDSGCGITEEEIKKIFGRYYSVDSEEGIKGTGIGLTFSRELAKIHGGDITVESQVGKGSKFTFWFPVVALTLESTNPETQTLYSPASSFDMAEQTTKIDPNHPLILVVDDNAEMRQHLKDVFKEKFNVIEAQDGSRALNKALEYQPDMIISDIIMPNTDGIELIKKMKNDFRIAHIPVILVTALHSNEDKIRGLSAGASDFIEKPFNAEEVFLKVTNILRVNSELIKTKEKVSREQKNSDVETSFLELVIKYLDDNIYDSELDISSVIQHFGMSKSAFYRKLKKHTSQGFVDIVRDLRLKNALTYLKQGDLNVNEVAFKIGFKDPGYFIRLFKQKYGKTPGEIQDLL